MPGPEMTYFTCTLGEAAQDDVQNPYLTVNQLIDHQAEKNSDLPAVGIYHVSTDSHGDNFRPKFLTFGHVRNGIVNAADPLSRSTNILQGSCVGLLAASSPDFFFTWLACIWLGHPVLLIAPQCSPAAIAHLCKTCDVSLLFVDEKHEDLAEKSCKYAAGTNHFQLSYQPIPLTDIDDLVNDSIRKLKTTFDGHITTKDSIAYLHHTSGTSSGLPKPIPQSHHGAVGVLPALTGEVHATFTTTPLYHGGPADIFRAWTSNAMIWLFPSKDVPITARNVTKCLEAAQELSQAGNVPPIKYFTSVPYILQIMAEDDRGLTLLQNMDLVGVGGAALATEVGDKLVEQDVNLVSRFGSAECGFLLSSHRPYTQDKAWQYLRHNEEVTQIKFEPRDEDLYELVIEPNWPHMAKRNREDGSYVTSDLFAKHPDIPNAWKYHSRADSQLTLVTGKKFDPAPLESAMVAASNLISDALVFGNGKPYPGVLLFRSQNSTDMGSDEVLKNIVSVIEKLNSESQSHARIPTNMLILMDFVETPLEKSSKGTILRNQAEETYAREIENAYKQIADNTSRDVSDEELPDAILDLVRSIVKDSDGLSADADLFAQGIDSVACVQIRHGLSLLLPQNTTALPLTVVEDSRTVTGLAELTKRIRHGSSSDTRADQRSHIPDLVQKYSDVTQSETSKGRDLNGGFQRRTRINVLLTGPTGSLGAHVLHRLLARNDIEHIYLLVRGASAQAARERVLKALSSRLLLVPADFDQKVTILQCKLSEASLGLSSADYRLLQENVDIILHLAWAVNFLLSLHSFVPHLAGIQNLMKLSISSQKPHSSRLVFCSSVASVSQFSDSMTGSKCAPEGIVANINSSGSTGYALSKLTAELLLARAATTTPSLRNCITIVRVGQLSADTRTGIWNKSEAYPQILASAKFTSGTLPDLGTEEKLTWLPVDMAAEAYIEACLANEKVVQNIPSEHVKHESGRKPQTTEVIGHDNESSKSTQNEEHLAIDTDAVRVLHLLNPDTNSTFTDFLSRVQTLSTSNLPQQPIKIVPAPEWLEALESLGSNEQSSSSAQPLLRLLPFWKDAYSSRQPSHPDTNTNTKTETQVPNGDSNTRSPISTAFNMHNSLLAMPSLTSWLGLNTREGREAGHRELNGFTSMYLNVNINGNVNHREHAGLSDGEGTASRDRDWDQGVQTELLRSGYVMKVWNWVIENVP